MSLSTLMGMPLSQIRGLEPETALRSFAMKTQDRNTMIEPPSRYKIAVPASIGVVLGITVAYLSKRGG